MGGTGPAGSATPTVRPDPTRNTHRISTTSADANALDALDAMRRAYPDATVDTVAAVLPPIAACRERTLGALTELGLPG